MAKKTTATNAQALAALDQKGLVKELGNLQREFYLLRMKHVAGELKETHLLKLERKKIARAKTFLNAL